MNFLGKSLFPTLCLCAGLAGGHRPALAADLVPERLRQLAANAPQRQAWPRLRDYAKSLTEPEWQGWAYFLVGYREYQGRDYANAAQDLLHASQSGFRLADYAVLYRATALNQAGRAGDAAAALQDFPVRFPGSRLQGRALTLRAQCFMTAQEPQRAMELLDGQPVVREQPSLALLFAQACRQSQHRLEAAHAFQDVYYKFPASAQAKAADDALSTLALQLGPAYPVPGDDLKAMRAEGLLDAGSYADALKVYSDLLADEPGSASAPRWRLGQARCLVRLRRSADGLQTLFTPFSSPDLDAQRLALLVQFHVQRSDAAAISQDLAQLRAAYPKSTSYAEALSTAGMFYYRQLNWPEAGRTYRRLFELFPQTERLREDYWRLAWCDYLTHDPGAARVVEDYLKFYPDSPRTPAAMYWLAKIQEERGELAEARALYALLTRRFAHSYYTPQAAARLAALRSQQGNLTGPNDSAAAPIAAAMISVVAPPVAPAGLVCLAANPGDSARPALILQALNLQDVEEQFLRSALNEVNPPAELRLLLAQVYVARNNSAAALFSALRTVPEYSRMEFSELPKLLWDFLYPQTYREIIETQARLNNLDPFLVMGLVRQESGFNPGALSVANARGLMQLLPQTAARSTRSARMRYAAHRLYDPAYNVQAGCAYLAQLMKEFDNKPEMAVAAYNAGDFRVKDWLNKSSLTDPELFLESIPISATRTYTELVLRDAEVYRQLLSGSPQFAECSVAPASGLPNIAAGPPGNSALILPPQAAPVH